MAVTANSAPAAASAGPRLSVCLIARNEERNLPRCLASVAGLADEVVVVLNDCSDRTEELARAAGARVLHQPWLGYRDQKNVALDACAGRWVLSLDADEELSPALRAELAAFLDRDGGGAAAAQFPRKVWFLGRWITHGDWYPDWSLRLVRRGAGRWGGESVHERMEVAGPVARLRGDLHHYSFADLEAHIRKQPAFARLYAEREFARGRRARGGAALSRAVWRFFRGYVLRAGFRDGLPGLHIALTNAYGSFLKTAALYELQIRSAEAGGRQRRHG